MKKTLLAIAGLVLLATISCREVNENVNFTTQEKQITKKEIMKRGNDVEIDSTGFTFPEDKEPDVKPPKK